MFDQSFATLEEMVVATAEMVRPPERLTVSEAASKYRYLDNPGSYVGYWPNEKTPYLVEPMDVLTSHEFNEMIFVGPARTGKSDMFFNWLTYTAKCDPADMLFVGMTKDVSRDWSLGDLAKAMRHTKALGEKLLPGRKNDNVHDKFFTNGMRLLIKWPTITELSGKTVPRVWLADYDRMEDDIAKEGPPFDLAKKRTQTYKRFAMAAAESSPGRPVLDAKWVRKTPHEAPPTKGILSLYNRGDRRRWYWRCLQCRDAFEPHFGLFSYPSSSDFMEAAEAVTLVCPHCGYPHLPEHKKDLQELNHNARWIKDGQVWLPNGEIEGKPRRTEGASFYLRGPAAAFQDWQSLVFNYLNAMDAYERTGDETQLKKTITADQGDPYTPKAMEGGRLPEDLKSRAQNWGGTKDNPIVPPEVRFLVATIDVQAGLRPSFVVHVFGISERGDVYHIDMFKIRESDRLDDDGKPLPLNPATHGEDWNVIIKSVIEKSYPLAGCPDMRMSIKLTGCDSGGAAGVTTNALNFWRSLRDDKEGRSYHTRFYLLRGEHKKDAPRVRLSYPDAERRDRNSGARGDVPMLFIHSNQVKDLASGMLGRGDTGERSDVSVFGTVHFPHWAEDWLYSQLTTEVRTAKGWENPNSKRNEAFDLLYYCLGLIIYPPINIEQLDWSNPPGWAAEWKRNDLVFKDGDKLPFSSTTVTYDLEALARDLA